VTKFVGKFRKNQDYNDDYSFVSKKRNRNEHSEIKKLKTRWVDEYISREESLPKKYKHH
jgi:hypothetical protein